MIKHSVITILIPKALQIQNIAVKNQPQTISIPKQRSVTAAKYEDSIPMKEALPDQMKTLYFMTKLGLNQDSI